MNCICCGTTWKIDKSLSAYEGEIVLVCEECGERYYNAQDDFDEEKFSCLEEIIS